MNRFTMLACLTACALVTSFVPVAHAQPDPRSPDGVRVRVEGVDGAIRVSVDETFTFQTPEEALRWIESRAAAWTSPPDLTVQADGEAAGSLRGIIDRIAKLDWKGTTLSLPAKHLAEIERIGTQIEKEKVIHFGTFLSAYYEEQFGKDYAAPMWKDLQRALREKRVFLATNLMLSLPIRKDAQGNDTWFADLPEDARLSEDCLRNWMEMALSKDISIETRRILVDNLARINERRAMEFCLLVLTREGDPVWLRGTGIRAFSRIRDRNEILLGKHSMTLIPPKEDEEGRRILSEAAAKARTWWAAAKASWPPQVLPSSRER
jgi:hypothetical protein